MRHCVCVRFHWQVRCYWFHAIFEKLSVHTHYNIVCQWTHMPDPKCIGTFLSPTLLKNLSKSFKNERTVERSSRLISLPLPLLASVWASRRYRNCKHFRVSGALSLLAYSKPIKPISRIFMVHHLELSLLCSLFLDGRVLFGLFTCS